MAYLQLKNLLLLKEDIKKAKDPVLEKLEKTLKGYEKSTQNFLNVAVERYPVLKSMDNLKGFQAQLKEPKIESIKLGMIIMEVLNLTNTH